MVCGMSSSNAFKPPSKNGVGPSTVGIPANTSLCAIEFLASKFKAISLEEWQQRFQDGHILNAEGRVMSPQDSLLHETHIHYYRSVRDEPKLPFKAHIICQDAHLLVADKPHFMPVTPGGRYVQQSLLVQLKQQFNLPDLSPLHRIDRETAGLVLFSVRTQDRNAYQALFRHRQVEKTYEAIARAPESSPLKLEFPRIHKSWMAEDTQFFRMRELVNSLENSDNPTSPDPLSESFNSETWMDCIERFSAADAEKAFSHTPAQAFAKYLLKPLTGQRHQLRVHMNALGLPLLGDQFYPVVQRGPDEADDFKRPLQLLAKTLAFKDPVTGESRRFESRQRLALPS
jgi:tRNA pseudouridine32 synthase/23S rRNA pseudouridine746 synthase